MARKWYIESGDLNQDALLPLEVAGNERVDSMVLCRECFLGSHIADFS